MASDCENLAKRVADLQGSLDDCLKTDIPGEDCENQRMALEAATQEYFRKECFGPGGPPRPLRWSTLEAGHELGVQLWAPDQTSIVFDSDEPEIGAPDGEYHICHMVAPDAAEGKWKIRQSTAIKDKAAYELIYCGKVLRTIVQPTSLLHLAPADKPSDRVYLRELHPPKPDYKSMDPQPASWRVTPMPVLVRDGGDEVRHRIRVGSGGFLQYGTR